MTPAARRAAHAPLALLLLALLVSAAVAGPGRAGAAPRARALDGKGVVVPAGASVRLRSRGLVAHGAILLRVRAEGCRGGARLLVGAGAGWSRRVARVPARWTERRLAAAPEGTWVRLGARGTALRGERCRVSARLPVKPKLPGASVPAASVPAAPAPGTAPVVAPAPSPASSPTPAAPAIRLGTAVGRGQLTGDPRYAATLAGAGFGSITPENEMKWDAVEPARGQFDFRAADAIVDWAAQHGMAVRGHTLLWHEQLPSWVRDGTWTRDELIAVLRQHVTAVVTHFRGRVTTWDVVNEPLDDHAGELRDSVWSRVIGPDFLDVALAAARAADPTAKLYVNEYANDLTGAKVDGLVRLASGLKARRAPLDGIGMQMHLRWDYPGTQAQLATTMRRYAALGLAVDVTELDVKMAGAPGTPEEVRARQARIYGLVGATCRSVPACRSLTTWGFTDASTWLGAEQTPLPFDVDYVAKPAWAALRTALGSGA